ncbi:hypothetical protein [Saccharolobus islandicus]|uniref:Uncharacterized protein n=1 Tax=Saccharolobus islandicus (strain L.D.8.5 / Lassen \|nr:hypothetical protein [Sulfolobus islandicus]ADB87502.1 hypothetical protein LD85_1845 [Sulfolobus islandicus L.D.8.5]
MSTFSTEITTALGTLSVSTLIYLLTTFIQQRTKKNNTLRLIGTVYGPMRHFIEVRYVGMVANVLFLTFMFLFILSLLLDFILGSDSGYLIKIIIFIFLTSGMLLYYVYFNFLIKRDQTIRELIDESSAYSTVDIDSQTLRWKALYWGTLVLAERYFLLIFIAVVSITSALSFLNKGFTVLGVVLIVVYIISFFLSLGLAMFLRFISLRSNNKRLKVSFFDTSDEIESRSFNLIKELSLCLCIVDDNGNKHCGSLEGISYNVLIRDMGGILVGIPYDHVYRVEECKVKDDNTGSTLQPYL